jgi:phosphoribosylpyrophosphate synthetase
MTSQVRILTGMSNDELADLVARGLGLRLGASAVSRFPDGEVSVEIPEPVLDRDVYLVDYRREVAGTENPEFRRTLQLRCNFIEEFLGAP